ncbi:MAG: oxidoreductase [Verrucomicrobia bacterium]|nr:oxidoreductase [Kiritimatiellia bacterium]MCP5487593.1 oxidoreductase [Verrucomicrobiota bacterium]
MTSWLPLLVLLPFAGAVLCLLVRGRGAPAIGVATSLATAALVLFALWSLQTSGPVRVQVGGWGAPLGIDLAVDGLSMIHLIMTAVIGLFISLYANRYYDGYRGGQKDRARELFWPFWLMLWGAMNALFVSADLFNLYVVLELVGLSAVGLVVLTGTRDVLGAGLRYLLTALAGSMCYLMGVALLYAAHGTLDLFAIGALIQSDGVSRAALMLMVTGLLMKTAVFPLHFWLPPAHASATAPVSALLSALVVKASFYILLRLWFDVFPGVTTPLLGNLLGLLGGGAILWGSLQALRQKRLKLLIAYSTVAQLGYLMFLFPVTAGMADGSSLWLQEVSKGTVCHVLSHALAKASIFLSAGLFILAAGTDQMSAMKGLAERMPLTVFSMALAAVSLMGLPPSGGFIAKWLIMHAVLGVGQWWWAPFLVIGGLLTAGYMFMMLRPAFLEPDPGPGLKPVPRLLEVCTLALAMLSIGIGISAANLLNLVMIGNPFSIPGGGW